MSSIAVKEKYLIGHTMAVLFCGVDQRLVKVHHQDQFLIPVESLLVFSAELLCLLLAQINTINKILHLKSVIFAFSSGVSWYFSKFNLIWSFIHLSISLKSQKN